MGSSSRYINPVAEDVPADAAPGGGGMGTAKASKVSMGGIHVDSLGGATT